MSGLERRQALVTGLGVCNQKTLALVLAPAA